MELTVIAIVVVACLVLVHAAMVRIRRAHACLLHADGPHVDTKRYIRRIEELAVRYDPYDKMSAANRITAAATC